MAIQKKGLGIVVVGLLLGILMAAMDNTIVATAMGTIIGDLGGLDKYVWVTSAYMVAEMAGMPIFGKLSDMYGRKKFFVFGLLMFMLGSVLCGQAHSIVQLSIFRAVQGIGGGALVPIAFTIVFDVFPVEARGKMSGLFGAVFGTSSLFGPLLGAYITDHIDWRWVFYINLPLGMLSFVFVTFFYKESHEHSKQRIDWWGAITLVAAVVCLMFGLELGGNKYDWGSPQIISLFAGFVVLFCVFFAVERRAEEPIISFEMFKNRLYAASNIVGLMYGIAFIVAAVYIPLFVQGVYGGTATNSGLILLPMTVGSVVAAQVGGFATTKTSYRNIMIFSAVIFVVGTYLLGTITPETSKTVLTIYMIIVGFGVGFSFSVLSMAAIHGFDMRQRGSANATMGFVRELGMTVGISVFGILQRDDFTKKLTDALASIGAGPAVRSFGTDSRALLAPALRAHIPAPILEKITAVLSSSISHTFAWTLLPAALGLVFVFVMSNERLEVPAKPVKVKEAEGR